ncbi:MAG: TetR/AcrR family transcriptional regulator [Parvularculaceae bacterium]|nr:TetR/AcrR family transcriptional regulator [Parvularculaceae bacterium]
MARPVKLTDDVLLTRTLSVFRETGYAGASLSKLSEATGLKRASLYHRFPGGKEELATETVAALKRWVDAQLISALQRPGPPQERLEAAAHAFALLYDHGRDASLINLFGSPSTTPPKLIEATQSLLSSIVAALSNLLEEAGVASDVARARSMKAMATLEGAVVLARTFRDSAPFDSVMTQWLDDLMPEGALLDARAKTPEPAPAAPKLAPAPAPETNAAPAPKPPKPTSEVRRTVARHLAMMRRG